MNEAPERDEPVLDERMLLELEEIMGDEFAGLLRLFSATAAQHAVTMREALTKQDPVALGRATHSLLGASRNVGACRLVAECTGLDALARRVARGSGEMAACSAGVARVAAEVERARTVIGNRFGPGPA